MSRHGREKMIQELERAQKIFDAADERLTEIAKPLREKYGLSDAAEPRQDEVFEDRFLLKQPSKFLFFSSSPCKIRRHMARAGAKRIFECCIKCH